MYVDSNQLLSLSTYLVTCAMRADCYHVGSDEVKLSFTY